MKRHRETRTDIHKQTARICNYRSYNLGKCQGVPENRASGYNALALARMKLGIVTISYNQAGYLQEAIDSVALADLSRLVYVIVDPGSTDGSRDVITRNRHRFPRAILEPDNGPADGLNK